MLTDMAAPKKKASPVKKAVKKQEPVQVAHEKDEWERWESRIKSLAILAVAIAGVINELFFREAPRETVLVFLGSVIGLPLVISGAKKVS